MFQTQFYSELNFSNGSTQPLDNHAIIKSVASDFNVTEHLGFECSGEGEHIWLNITKVELHTTQVAKTIARLANVAPKHIGFSGMKDHRAVTSQWFSVWLPGIKDADLPDWQCLNDEKLRLNQVTRHTRKLKRGTHIANEFKIRLTHFAGDEESFLLKLKTLLAFGVPNYFGEQRFGFAANNLNQALDWFRQGYSIKQPNKRSVLLSSARAWLFNVVLSERLKQRNWLTVYDREPLNLSGSKSYFISNNPIDDQARVDSLDLNTTGPLWGKGVATVLGDSALHDFEQQALKDHAVFLQGLEQAGLSYERRSLRFFPQQLTWHRVDDCITLNFSLSRGQFATALLRELVRTPTDSV